MCSNHSSKATRASFLEILRTGTDADVCNEFFKRYQPYLTNLLTENLRQSNQKWAHSANAEDISVTISNDLALKLKAEYDTALHTRLGAFRAWLRIAFQRAVIDKQRKLSRDPVAGVGGDSDEVVNIPDPHLSSDVVGHIIDGNDRFFMQLAMEEAEVRLYRRYLDMGDQRSATIIQELGALGLSIHGNMKIANSSESNSKQEKLSARLGMSGPAFSKRKKEIWNELVILAKEIYDESPWEMEHEH